ncbi:MAG: hypothetical protein ACD_79C00270G0009 [uncultured bacterium]|nr:MAG: hypothetical protein ACD_79C00270G0009 [uncultured bacterium]
MITHQEIKNLESEWGLREDVIEKDYVLGWLLWGIGQNSYLSEHLIFKGGTSLKKCFIETWRFSEDLDFTFIPKDTHFGVTEMERNIKAMLDSVYNESGIDFSVKPPKFKLFDKYPYYLEGRIYYRGPRNSRIEGSVKLDILSSEEVFMQPVFREIHHPYSDRLPENATVKCYSFEEVFTEKIRAMAERCRPRDLFDIILLYRDKFQFEDMKTIRDLLEKKCNIKKLSIPTLDSIKNSSHYPALEGEWKNMLAHQLPHLPPIASFLDDLIRFFDWLEAGIIAEAPIAIATHPGENIEIRQYQGIQHWNAPVPLEKIRYAAVNHLFIKLLYRKQNEETKEYILEPYSLRRKHSGELLLYALKEGEIQPKQFRVDRMIRIEITNKPFIPRYKVEFASTGFINAPEINRTEKQNFSEPFKQTHKRSSFILNKNGIQYIFQCPYCQKKFSHLKKENKLKSHKDKNGYQCSGKSGYYIECKN